MHFDVVSEANILSNMSEREQFYSEMEKHCFPTSHPITTITWVVSYMVTTLYWSIPISWPGCHILNRSVSRPNLLVQNRLMWLLTWTLDIWHNINISERWHVLMAWQWSVYLSGHFSSRRLVCRHSRLFI